MSPEDYARKRRADDTARVPLSVTVARTWGTARPHASWLTGGPADPPKIAPNAPIDVVVDNARIGTGPRRRLTPAAERMWRGRAMGLSGAVAGAVDDWLPPQLCRTQAVVPSGEDWLHEIKWDGYRLLASMQSGCAKLRSRSGEDWTARFPAVADALESLGVADARLDGELVALDEAGRSNIERLQQALHSGQTGALRYLLFDLPALAGVDLRAAPLLARKQLLETLLRADVSGVLAYGRHIVGHGERVLDTSVEQRVAGIVSKRVDSPYVSARSPDWMRIAHDRSEDLIVVGFSRPSGGHAHGGWLVVAAAEAAGPLNYRARVPVRQNDAVSRELFRRLESMPVAAPAIVLTTGRARGMRWVQPQLIVEVSFRGISPEGRLRAPGFRRLRDDKTLADLLTV